MKEYFKEALECLVGLAIYLLCWPLFTAWCSVRNEWKTTTYTGVQYQEKLSEAIAASWDRFFQDFNFLHWILFAAVVSLAAAGIIRLVAVIKKALS